MLLCLPADDSREDAERRDICLWLERTNPSSLHNAAVRKHEPHTSAWLKRSSEWHHWVSSSSADRLLWIYGIPGSGKPVLASFAIEELKALRNDVEGCIYAYYYCHYSRNQDGSLPFLTWTISQACRQTGWLPNQLKRIRDWGCEPTIPELEQILETVLERVEMLYLVIDAVDESKPREELVRLLATMALDPRFRKISILATSRQYFDIERVFIGISASISMANPYVNADIEHFVRARLASSYRLKRWQESLQTIQDVLVQEANGM